MLVSVKDGFIETDLWILNLLTNTSILSFHLVILITLNALFLTALHFAFAASFPARRVTYSVLMNLLTTLPVVVTTRPYSRHKYSVPQTVPRADALKDKPPTRTETTPFVITYNPTLLYVAHIIHKHSHVLYSSERCRNVFKNLLTVSYCHSNILSDILVRVQLPETDNCNNARATPGSFRCNSRNCTTCAYIDHARPWQLYFLLYGWNLKNQISHYLQYFQCYLHDSMPPLYKICNILGKLKRHLQDRFNEYRLPILNPIR